MRDRYASPGLGLALAVVLVAGCLLIGVFDANAQPYVEVNGDRFVLGASEFKFVGVNLAGIAFKDDGEISEQVGAANDMGTRVIRIFGAQEALGATEVISDLENLFNLAEGINPDLKFIVALTDFYPTEYTVIGDKGDGYYTNDDGSQGNLVHSWFEGGFRTNYKGFAETVVAHFAADDRIFAWEVGNELSYNLGSGVVVSFVQEMVGLLRGTTVGAQQLISSGYISVNHAIGGNGDIGTTLATLYGNGASPGYFDYVTVHTYNNEWSDPPCDSCPFSRQIQEPDIGYSATGGLPLVLGEFGFTGSLLDGDQCHTTAFPGGNFEDVPLPSAEKERTQATKLAINKFYDEKGADGILQWGFMAGPDDNGLGDKCSGVDDGLNNNDWGHGDRGNMTATYRCRFDRFEAQFGNSFSRPDVYLKGITWEPANPNPGDTVTFTVRVFNGGNAATGSAGIGVGLFIGPPETNPVPASQAGFAFDPISLSPGQEVSLLIEAEAPPYGAFTVAAVADDLNRFAELAECNNALYLDVEGPIQEAALDLCIACDTTGSMGPFINAAKVAATAIVDAVFEVSSSPRVAVTDFRDYPFSPWGTSGDYPFRIRTDFTADQTAIVGGVQSLNLGNGRDFPESVFAGLTGCILGKPGFYYSGPSLDPWRVDATKAIILMGDAPPHDPEPVSSYDLAGVIADANAAGTTTSTLTSAVPGLSQSVSQRLPAPVSAEECASGEYDGVRIFAIHIGTNGTAGSYFRALADGTCGRYINALSPAEVVEAILEVIGEVGGPTTNLPPEVGDAFPSVDEVWPPNHKWVEVEILGVTDPEGEEVTIAITGITQDEPVAGPGRTHSPDGGGVGSSVAEIRAERDGGGNGRVYEISFSATDASGASAAGSVQVCVPHDQGDGGCVDEGQTHDSTLP